MQLGINRHLRVTTNRSSGSQLSLWLLLGAIACSTWFIPKTWFLTGLREAGKVSTLMRTKGLHEVETEHFKLRYSNANEQMVSLVGDTVEQHYQAVVADLDYRPKEKTTVVLYPSRQELAKSFGWDADESAMGVYWAGVIRILAPDQWIEPENPEFEEIFRQSGPMLHEFTHYIVDYKTKGNYTRWLTEGIAQFEEAKHTGFVFQEPNSSLTQPLYALSQMGKGFDALPNQNLAYRQSLVAVLYMQQRYGQIEVNQLLTQLGTGTSLDRSMRLCWGISLAEFEKDLFQWIQDNAYDLDNNLVDRFSEA